MRRHALLTLAVTGMMLLGAGTAGAKGITDHAKVTIVGAGLPGGIVTLGEDGAAFALGSQPWQDKWDAPNIGGTLEPAANLGRAYLVRAVMDCEGGERSRYRQTLYPDAPEGPQLFTPTDVEVCGITVPAGYDALGPAMTALLERHGVEPHPKAASSPTSSPQSSADNSMPALAAIGVPFALLALVGEEIVRRRRRRR